MKKILSMMFIVLFLSGCANLNPEKKEIESKTTLIGKADLGDIKAMLELNKYYKFPQTQEGLFYFDKWYENLDEKDKTEDVLDIAKVYFQYKDMFINGDDKTIHLLKVAAKSGNVNAQIKLLELYSKLYKRADTLQLEKELLPTLKEEELHKLYKIYKNSYNARAAKRVSEFIEKKGFKAPFEQRLKNLRALMYNKKKADLYNSFINEVVTSKNIDEINKTADFLYIKYKYTKALYLYEELLKLDPKNEKALLAVSNIYKKGNYREKLKKDKTKAMKYLIKAQELGNKEASLELLKTYSDDKKFVDKFFELKEKLENDNEGKIIIAKYYRAKRLNEKANQLFEELAEDGNKEAILQLALRKPSKYNFNPDEYKTTQKWQNYIINGNDHDLKEKFKKQLLSYKYKKAFKDVALVLLEKDIQDKNIIVLRQLYKDYKYKEYDKAFEYLKLAASYQDVKSTLDLAKQYVIKKGKKDFNKAVETLKPIANKGDFKANKALADLYITPPHSFNEYKDIEKGLSYYENLANKGNIPAMKKLADKYMCSSCSNGNLINYKKALHYVKMLDDAGYPKYTASAGWMYNFGKGVEIDKQKAKMYYEKAEKMGYAKANYYLAWLYYRDEDSNFEPIELNYEKAIVYLRRGAELKDAESTNLLGRFYELGYAVKKDRIKAVELYKKVARYSKYASFHLATYYRDMKDYAKALKYYQISARRGNGAAFVEVGIIHEQGSLGSIDIKKAIKSYAMGYERHKKKVAAYNLGLIYHYRKGGVEQDLKLAKSWYRKAGTALAKKQAALIK